ncbi:ABC transporter, permease protein [Syntrophomonas zehnderi OL-4]|uniref:ABC transporter, permease protein n=1 Tax=Syntrophomonas zehnderi OL-4 TaxID=690567 RepID=A0A0E4GEC6_9FIRM|nr:iron ABC transporter permease [Syntrophomonas zehnderi]CFX84322.1 ABC transporter, permease protein [Syntrophomonas zehnderi OL-4]
MQTVLKQKIAATGNSKSNTGRIGVLLLVLVVIFILSFTLGRYSVPPSQLLQVLGAQILPLEKNWGDTVETVIFQVRLPRILAAIMIGAALSAAGAAYQGMFKNPLVSPDILGASAGAGFGAALGIYFAMSMVGVQIMAFIGGLVAVALTYGISLRIKHDPMLALVLSGIMIGSLFTAAISCIKYIADPYDKLPAITFWLMGSLASINLQDIYMVVTPIMVGMIVLFLLRWRLNVMAMGEEEAQVLGLNTRRLKTIVILCCTLMTAASVSIGGLIGWVGLVIPHLARMIVGPNYRVLLPASILLGGAYLLLVDDMARLLASMEIPLGILTALIGVPFFLYLLLNSKWGWK